MGNAVYGWDSPTAHCTWPWTGLCQGWCLRRVLPQGYLRARGQTSALATFHPAHTTRVQPFRSSKSLYYCLHPPSSENLFPQGSSCSFFAVPFTESSSLCRRWRKTSGTGSTFGLKAIDLWWSLELVMHPGQQIILYIWLETQAPLLLLRALVQAWELRLPVLGQPCYPGDPHPCPP